MKEKDIKYCIDQMIIKVDTREKKKHITDCFDKYGVNWERTKLCSGDYSAYLPPQPQLNINEPIVFDDIFVIERKKDADEIANNLTKGIKRFKNEFERSNANIQIMIEKSTYLDLVAHNYRSKLTPKQILGLLHGFCVSVGSEFIFVEDNVSPLYIYNCFKYRLKNILKNK